MLRKLLVCGSFAFAVPAGCGSGASSVAARCGEPPPTAAPDVALVFPAPGATGVAVDIGALILSGGSAIAAASIAVTSPGAGVPIGIVTAAPSPVPSPNALPSYVFPGGLREATIGTLAPATTYSVTYSYAVDRSGPSSCDLHFTNPLGSFTTR